MSKYRNHCRFELDETNTIFLKYWLTDDRAISAADLLLSEDLGNHITPTLFAKGFQVPDEYLGARVDLRLHPKVIDHLMIYTRIPILQRVKFGRYRMFLSVVMSKSKPRSSAASLS